MRLPKARIDNIVVQNLKTEVLIYDLKDDKAFCLNETCARVYERCDGQTALSELKRKFGYTDDIIYFALDELHAARLLENAPTNHFAGMSRREVIRRVGLSSLVAIPIVAGMIAPRAAQAASGIVRQANGNNCGNNNQCLSGRCSTSNAKCCSSDNFGACVISADCCTGVACTNTVCCQGNGRTCDTRENPSSCCQGLRCVAPAGQTNGTCQ